MRAYYAVYRFLNSVKDFPKEVKWFIQRGRRGYADSDLWSLDWYLSSWMPEALRKLAKEVNGCPSELYDHKAPTDHECHRWERVLREIADGFEASRKLQDMEEFDIVKKEPKKLTKEDMRKIDIERKRLGAVHNRGMDLFKKHYFGLWD
jgi:hypothetical protein